MVILEDLDDDRQAEAGALGAGRDVGFDQLVAILVREALAVVADGDADDAVVDREGDRDPALLFARSERVDALPRVLEHVGQRLRNQATVEFGDHRLRRQVVLEGDVGSADPHQEQRLADAIGEIILSGTRFRHARKR